MSKHIIPVFVPHKGCPHDCVFCNQKKISGCIQAPSEEQVHVLIQQHLKTQQKDRELEIAFFGGSFTGIPLEEQERYLQIATAYRKQYPKLQIRASTRPDCIKESVISLLQRYQVNSIELGVQSMHDNVLKAAGRGHTAEDVTTAVQRLKQAGIIVGIQTMLGLPGDTREGALQTAREVIGLQPAMVRIYPTLVIRDTALETLYTTGKYQPLELEDAVTLTAELMDLYEDANIPVIRVGLQPTEQMESEIIAGPYHPAFRQLANSIRAYKEIERLLKLGGGKSDKMEVQIQEESKIAIVQSGTFSPSDIIGQKGCNRERLEKSYGYQLQVVAISS